MFGVASAVAELAEQHLHAPDLRHDLVECHARAVRVRPHELLRELCVSADRGEWLLELGDDASVEVELRVGLGARHRRAPAVARVSTTTRVSGSSVLRMRAIAPPPNDGMSASTSATSGRNHRTSPRACAPSSASPTTSMHGSLSKLARSARRNVLSPSPMSTRIVRPWPPERGAGRLRPLRSSGGVGEIGLVCTAPTISPHRTRHKVPFGYAKPARRKDVPEWALVERLLGPIVGPWQKPEGSSPKITPRSARTCGTSSTPSETWSAWASLRTVVSASRCVASSYRRCLSSTRSSQGPTASPSPRS